MFTKESGWEKLQERPENTESYGHPINRTLICQSNVFFSEFILLHGDLQYPCISSNWRFFSNFSDSLQLRLPLKTCLAIIGNFTCL